MNKIMNFFHGMLIILCLCVMLTGCSTIQDKIKEYSSDKVQCFLKNEDVTQFTFKGKKYTILEDTVANENLGEWIGYIRQLVAVDETGAVLIQENIEDATFKTLTDLAEKAPDAKYIIPFLNIYTASNEGSYLIVDVNGGYHKAVLSNQLTETDIVFDFKMTTEKMSRSYILNPQNATQIVSDDLIYQVTTEKVSEDQLGKYLDILAEKVTFDVDTKIPLTKDELNEVDWSGGSSGQRESWFYVDVYEISGINISEAVAVKVNNQYYVAKVL